MGQKDADMPWTIFLSALDASSCLAKTMMFTGNLQDFSSTSFGALRFPG